MKGFKKVGSSGHYGMLVFAKVVRNVLWDENLETSKKLTFTSSKRG